MRITRVSTLIVDIGRSNSIFVLIETDRDLVGVGETVMRRRDLTVQANIHEIGAYLVGKDALATEDHFEKLYRDSFWLGGPLHAAGRSAVDIALWDLKGQFYNAPIYQLLGGSTRDKVQAYGHAAAGSSPEEFVENLLLLKARGFQAAKTNMPYFYGNAQSDGREPFSASLKETEHVPTWFFLEAERWMKAGREAVGPDFEIMLDCHGRLSVLNAIRLGEALGPYRPYWLEEPIPPESAIEYARVARRVPMPVAGGERLVSVWDVRPFLEAGALGVLQCDIANCGGFTGAKKIAALAEAFYVPFAPHNPNGPVATVATAHLMKSIPNGLLMEVVGSDGDREAFKDIVDAPPLIEGGRVTITDAPGLGVRLRDDLAARRPAGTYGGTR